ncbi:MAG: AAA family ATPase, partial [Clostridia bacterium]|nr:AAA family ATPase [Clostridia bacterium]
FDEYPFSIPIIKSLTEINFEKPVTFIAGENGSGKSTIIEAIAVSIGLSAEGGTRNMVYETVNSTSVLEQYLTLFKSGIQPRWKYFLRAESFYTMAQAYSRYNYNSPEIYMQSHGEAFNSIFDGFSENGLYLMDEPESALSPKNQMRLLITMNTLVEKGCQFIIATHSPILLSYYNAQILNADNLLKPISFRETEIYTLYRRFLECPEKMQKYLFED